MTREMGMLEVARIQSEVNRLFDTVLGSGDEGQGGNWIPYADILETDETLLLLAELPGVDPADVKLKVDGGDVIIEGVKKRPGVDSSRRSLIEERRFGPFRLVLSLGVPVNTHKAVATLREGLLRVDFPKVPNRRGGAVSIEVTE